MEIAVTDVPRCIKSFAFSPRIILSENNTVEYLIRMKEYIFGSKCVENAGKIGVDVFDLVFINDKSFNECCKIYMSKLRDKDMEVVKTAFLLKKMYNGDYVRIAEVHCDGDIAYVDEPEYAYLDMLNDIPTESAAKRKFIEKREKKARRKSDLCKEAKVILESVRLAAVMYGMKSSIAYKELIDKYNYRRFSTNLRINNRPATIEEVDAVLQSKRDKCLADLSNTKKRLNFTALYAITYGEFKLSDLFSKDTVFENSGDKDKKLSELSCELINIIYNGNGIEIANMFIHMITTFAMIELPPVNMKNLGSVMENYSIYYATATLASLCENIFKYEGINGELKLYLRKHTIDNYWNCMDRLMLMKQYSVVTAFCYMMSNFDVKEYREDPTYQGEILYAFERATKFEKELKRS